MACIIDNSVSSDNYSTSAVMTVEHTSKYPRYDLPIHALFSKLTPDEWSTIKHQLHQYWLHVYASIFWILSVALSVWRTHFSQAHQQSTIDTLVFTESDLFECFPPWCTVLDDVDNQDKATYKDSHALSYSHTAAITSTMTNEPLEMKDSDSLIPEQQKMSSFKRVIKGRLNLIKQKQHSLNESMKRSIFTRKQSNTKLFVQASSPTSSIASKSSDSKYLQSERPTEMKRRMSDSLLKSLSLNKSKENQQEQRQVRRRQPLDTRSLSSASSDSLLYDTMQHPLDISTVKCSSNISIFSESRLGSENSFVQLRRKTSPNFKGNTL
ncbi:uncharacterized protein BYT42DRAFT_586337 [Radiomyces spectabilis]|uniref:uncharacterized protein n=1 Tax=Radiomyces spectabilis TaxID=64574 RepID=UPI00221F9B6F|nr:uncharacterized protein BYT42DRAFT_586337 [Radiomyces spectabilis]KAI8367464.1 hypothetical protein BYT42DRAFT_586337 [Radiomyces spectabilis]